MVGEISASLVSSATTVYKKVETSEQHQTQDGAKAQTASGVIKDKVTINAPTTEKAVTYSSPLTEQERLDTKFLMLRELVANIFKSQGLAGPTTGANQRSSADTTGTSPGSTLIDIGDGKTADISTMTPDDAKKLVADDGYWGVAKTADRIFQQAVAISGNDPTRIDKVKEGILKGFEMAKKAFGGELPDISQQTLDAVMKKLDNWVQNPDQQSAQGNASFVPV